MARMATSVGAGGRCASQGREGCTFSSRCGHRAARGPQCTGVDRGVAYYETALERLGATGFARVGVASREANLDASVGADAHGYAFIQRTGSVVHDRAPAPYADARVKEGDVVGVCLNLEISDAQSWFARISRRLRRRDSSYIEFYLNGFSLGRAFVNEITPGTYYPCVSLFTMPHQIEPATVRMNFHPPWIAPPKSQLQHRGFGE